MLSIIVLKHFAPLKRVGDIIAHILFRFGANSLAFFFYHVNFSIWKSIFFDFSLKLFSILWVVDKSKSRNGPDLKKEPPVPKDGSTPHIAAQTFTFRELAAATKNFRPECLLGEGGFGRVYKGHLESTGQVYRFIVRDFIILDFYCTFL